MTDYQGICVGCNSEIEIIVQGVIGFFEDCWCDECVQHGRSPY